MAFISWRFMTLIAKAVRCVTKKSSFKFYSLQILSVLLTYWEHMIFVEYGLET